MTITCAQSIRSDAAAIYAAFVEPGQLTRFWLASASAPLTVGAAVRWEFLVPGAVTDTVATRLEPGRLIAFEWADGPHVEIALDTRDGETDVRVAIDGAGDDPVAIANVIEGFTLVLSDLKLMLETGVSPGLVAAKARLIARGAA